MKRFFSIADIKISLQYDPDLYGIVLDKPLQAFACDAFDYADINLRIDISSPLPSIEQYRQLFTAHPEGLWTIFEDDGKKNYLITLQNIEKDKKPYKITIADKNFTDFTIYSTTTENNLVSPLEYPLADLAVSGHININEIGILLHSACISLEGMGYLFSGTSGAGKSTISEIWQADKDATVLTDERVVIREIDNNLWAFGTPWHGTAEVHKNMGAPIDKIFFIKHGKENRASLLSKRDALNRLIVRCFPTFWNREGMEFAVDFCTQIAEKKKCYELKFIPDASVTKYIKYSGL